MGVACAPCANACGRARPFMHTCLYVPARIRVCANARCVRACMRACVRGCMRACGYLSLLSLMSEARLSRLSLADLSDVIDCDATEAVSMPPPYISLRMASLPSAVCGEAGSQRRVSSTSPHSSTELENEIDIPVRWLCVCVCVCACVYL